MPEVIMPKMGDAMVEGKLLQWTKPDGATVKRGEVIAEIETDKSNVEIEAEDPGVLRVRVQVGDTVPVGEVIATIGDPSSAPVASSSAQPRGANVRPAPTTIETTVPAAPDPKMPAPQVQPKPVVNISGNNGHDRVKASPLARRVAREKGIDIALVNGTGPLGRVVEADVLEYAIKAPVTTAPRSVAPSVAPIEMSSIRKVIAKRMVESKTTIPHFYVTVDIDMTEAVLLREKLNAYDETLPKISFNDMIVKAAAKGLAKIPAANASFRDDKIFPGNGVHVGIAVALEDGLIVPVVRDADKVSLRSLASSSKQLIKKAKEKKLQPDEYSGGTFTVSNLGSFDVENFIAIIDPSQGAILAVASIVKKPVVLEDGVTIAVRDRMNLTLSADHRVMDGAAGAKLTQEIKRFLQNPISLLE